MKFGDPFSAPLFIPCSFGSAKCSVTRSRTGCNPYVTALTGIRELGEDVLKVAWPSHVASFLALAAICRQKRDHAARCVGEAGPSCIFTLTVIGLELVLDFIGRLLSTMAM